MNIKKWQIFASIFCLILGTILHFTYDWFNYNVIVGLFSTINESVWEHLKLLFYPMFFISIIGYFKIGRKLCNYWYAQMYGIVFALIFVVVFFYTYTGIIGRSFFLLDIASFIIGILLGEYIVYKMLKQKEMCKLEALSIITSIIILLCFLIFTIYPPILPLFEDPIYGTFGIKSIKID